MDRGAWWATVRAIGSQRVRHDSRDLTHLLAQGQERTKRGAKVWSTEDREKKDLTDIQREFIWQMFAKHLLCARYCLGHCEFNNG